MRKIILIFLLSIFSLKAQETSINWSKDLDLPYIDSLGKRLTGTEIIEIVSHKGKLYAGNSYWNEYIETRRGQVFIKNSANSEWKQDLQMPSKYSRIASMKSCVFQYDKSGSEIAPDTILFVGSTYDKGENKPGPAGIFIRNDIENNWKKVDLGSTSHAFAYTQIRSIGFHHDKITNQDIVFAGANPAPLGIYAGRYSKGDIIWDEKPEFEPQGYQRIMGFAEIGVDLYGATQKSIIKRIDGENPRWETILTLGDTASAIKYASDLDIYWILEDDIRGFRSIPVINNKKQDSVLMFTIYNKLFQFNPITNELLVELDLKDFISSETEQDFHYIQSGCNVDFKLPNGQNIQLIGVESFYDTTYLSKNKLPNIGGFDIHGRFVARINTINGTKNYLLLEIIDPLVLPQPDSLARVRTFCMSPFSQDSGKVIYAGGFAPWFMKEVTNTGWIYKGLLSIQYSNNDLYKLTPNIEYKKINGVEKNLLSLDIYEPLEKGENEKLPVICYVHGGSWNAGDKSNVSFKDDIFTKNKYVFISINYRLSPNPYDTSNQNRIMYPVHSQDVSSALAWVYKNIENYSGDKNRIGIIGHSAGGNIVSTVSTIEEFLVDNDLHPSAIKATCNLDGPVLNIKKQIDEAYPGRKEMLINAFGNVTEIWDEASPTKNVLPNNDLGANLFVHQDIASRTADFHEFGDSLNEYNYIAEYFNAKPYSHEQINQLIGSPEENIGMTKAIIQFFDKYLKNSTSIRKETIPSNVLLSPNPASEYIQINLDRWSPPSRWTPSAIRVYNTYGELVLTTQSLRDTPSEKENLKIDISHLPVGLYFIQIGNYTELFMVVR